MVVTPLGTHLSTQVLVAFIDSVKERFGVEPVCHVLSQFVCKTSLHRSDELIGRRLAYGDRQIASFAIRGISRHEAAHDRGLSIASVGGAHPDSAGPEGAVDGAGVDVEAGADPGERLAGLVER